MKDTLNDSDRSNPILDYPGYYMPGFFSWLLGEIPKFGLPDWGPIPQLQRERPVTPPSRNPNLPPAHEVDPPDRPPEWLFGPPRIVRDSPISRQTVAEATLEHNTAVSNVASRSHRPRSARATEKRKSKSTFYFRWGICAATVQFSNHPPSAGIRAS